MSTEKCKKLLSIALEPVIKNLDKNDQDNIKAVAEAELLFHLRIGSFTNMALHYAIYKATEDDNLRIKAESAIRPYSLFMRHLKALQYPIQKRHIAV